ncbi:WXG100 family type VII secretion target [[Pseudopropionibacterium] massiliense]|uniref:WXG100 family type VII secretion target n=1 Tax=[Pseudopropionibacterium] massiliense TaxID=2220000 RepID=UPI0010303D50|nr:WXG100 family type VII secretion target [[Pseudopropionibacterium] massiliense]
MAANLNVSYEAMESEASALVSGKEEITQKLSALKTRIDNLVSNGFVTDQASGAFNEMYQNFTTSASNTISSLDGIANGLRSMANAMRETDSQMASQIRG